MADQSIENPDRGSTDAADPGPPVLLKRLSNAVEANLAKNKLATAGIPAFLAGENAFAGDVMQPLPYRDVELYVPQSLVAEALAVLESPPEDPSQFVGDSFVDDPSRAASFRAFVASVVGWCVFVLGPYGVFFALPAFAYATYLAVRALTLNSDRAPSTVFKCVAALVVAGVGLISSVGVIVMLSTDLSRSSAAS